MSRWTWRWIMLLSSIGLALGCVYRTTTHPDVAWQWALGAMTWGINAGIDAMRLVKMAADR